MKHIKCIKVLFLLTVISLASCQDADDRVVITQPQLTPTAACPQPVNFSITNITQTTATLSWTNGGTETEWELAIMPAAAGAPTGPGIPATVNPYSLTGLSSGTTYQCYIKAVCSATESSSWSGPFTFTTI